MGTLRTRLRRLEKEAKFRRWLEFSRLLENLSDSQIEEIAIYFRKRTLLHDCVHWVLLTEFGRQFLRLGDLASRNDGCDIILRPKAQFKGFSRFLLHHGHWPEQDCGAKWNDVAG